jgi:hypothetical protein
MSVEREIPHNMVYRTTAIACQRITDAYAQPDLFVPAPATAPAPAPPPQLSLFTGGS